MPTWAASGGVPAPAASSTASNRPRPAELSTVVPAGSGSSACTVARTTDPPASSVSRFRTASTSITPPAGSSSAGAGARRTGSRSSSASTSRCAAPAAAIADAHSATPVPLITQPTGEINGRPLRSCQRANPARAVRASATSSGVPWASRKMRDDPAERSVIGPPARSKQTTSAPRSSRAAVVDSPTTPAPTTATRTAAMLVPRQLTTPGTSPSWAPALPGP